MDVSRRSEMLSVECRLADCWKANEEHDLGFDWVRRDDWSCIRSAERDCGRNIVVEELG